MLKFPLCFNYSQSGSVPSQKKMDRMIHQTFLLSRHFRCWKPPGAIKIIIETVALLAMMVNRLDAGERAGGPALIPVMLFMAISRFFNESRSKGLGWPGQASIPTLLIYLLQSAIHHHIIITQNAEISSQASRIDFPNVWHTRSYLF